MNEKRCKLFLDLSKKKCDFNRIRCYSNKGKFFRAYNCYLAASFLGKNILCLENLAFSLFDKCKYPSYGHPSFSYHRVINNVRVLAKEWTKVTSSIIMG